ncbi:hypothetical protein [Sphingobium yanoikuyae]|jgi:hypothetical protein|uniref:hypothetical protein n=1 Tax=Sphingobium yanoikuyae TaxID=13690 RepID=UPI0004E37399|nr:hypothetical protein [Sphingobium yanoikuyae]KFD25819.1 hypothetical protein IH86_23395 [Sphingobium yanoikuyae]KZC74979.1 hypothetical protein AYR46_23465 [Sphingobium yanoikuyae]MDV3478622.1 hypothetical protein [Sphingobium yanoikuyae]
MMSVTDLSADLPRHIEPTLHRLLSDRIQDARACGLGDLTHIIVVEPGDGEGDFIREADFSPFRNLLSETRFGDQGFEPPWCWHDRPEGWGWEAIHTVGNDGFAFIILVPDATGIDQALLAML